MSKVIQPKAVKSTHFMRGLVREMVLLLVVFLLGFIVEVYLGSLDPNSVRVNFTPTE